jgi:AraC-like DNA-binding protein
MRGTAKAGSVRVDWLWLPATAGFGAGRLGRCREFTKVFAEPTRQRELPSRYVTVMLSYGDPLVLVGAGGARRDVDSFATGLRDEPAITERSGWQAGIHVELTPLAAYALFGMPMRELAHGLVDLPALLGKDAARLADRLASTRRWPDRLALLQTQLAERISRGPQPAPAVAWAWQQLRAANGRIRIQHLVEQSGLSHRHLVAQFTEQIGLTPKAVARVLRFEHSLALLSRPATGLAQVAVAAGYYDQAHLNREFRALAGCSPAALRDSRSGGQIFPRPARRAAPSLLPTHRATEGLGQGEIVDHTAADHVYARRSSLLRDAGLHVTPHHPAGPDRRRGAGNNTAQLRR